jgi:hypothetical protein
MHHRLSLNNMKYPIGKLIEQIKSNRARHAEEYALAMEEYRKAIVEELHHKLAAAQAGHDINHIMQTVRPTQYLKDYDRAISMLGFTSDREVELDQDTYAQLVLDEWNWKNEFVNSTHTYLAGKYAGY